MFEDIFKLIIVVLSFVLIIGFAVFEIILFIEYGNKPAGEVPTWVLWLLFRGGN